MPGFLRRKRASSVALVEVRAVGVIWDEGYRRVLTIPGAQAPALPRIRCHGEAPPWQQLADAVGVTAGFYPSLRWVGVRQDLAHGIVELVFAATAREAPLRSQARWETARNSWLERPGRAVRRAGRAELCPRSGLGDRPRTHRRGRRHADRTQGEGRP